MKILKIVSVLLLIFLMSAVKVQAEELMSAHASALSAFSPHYAPEIIEMKIKKQITGGDIIIPSNAVITAEVLEAQKERRWHKSGYILLKLKYYEHPFTDRINLEDEEIYLTARRYEKFNKKRAVIIGVELTAASAASFFIPGIDIAYFFTKGAVLREKHANWFKAGVYNVYDNSICWLWLKGKPIEHKADDIIILKETDKEKAYKLKKKIEERKIKAVRKAAKKSLRQLKKAASAAAKAEKKLNKMYPAL